MKVKVEKCWGSKFYYRLTLPDGSREFVTGDEWTRKVASHALDLLEGVYHLRRRNIRFMHH